MTAGELREKLKNVPDNALVYLDDEVMITPRALSKMSIDQGRLYSVGVNNSDGRSNVSPPYTPITIVTLTTYQ